MLALHTELVHVAHGNDARDWTWELATTPVTRRKLARFLLADAAHERLCPITDWLGARPGRLARGVHDVTANLEVRLACFIHVRQLSQNVRIPLTLEQAATLGASWDGTEEGELRRGHMYGRL